MSSGQVIVVTGGFGALGAVVGRTFVKQGARVALVDRSSPPPSLAGQFGPDHVLRGGVDLTDAAATREAMSDIAGRLGGIDALVNVAGGFRWEKLENGDPNTWDLMFAINLRTAVVATQAVLPHLLARGAGSIVNIGAGAAAARAAAGMGAYTAAKAGVQRFTESLADELKDRGITVNAVLPGTIDTPQNRAAMPDADVSRWVAPEAIARVIAFLVSDAARAVTGASIAVNGRG
ncbi:MAG TPA: SDR family NAD(P)-dependent oxidoreductase [Steroidobacteraceae bacterium]|nr:SDR family NAD(P)-dependent oxidoreductase [Steroidobacteraceae bacterium]